MKHSSHSVSLFLMVLFLSGCTSSSTNYTSQAKMQSYIKEISMGSIYSSDFWRVSDRDLFIDALKKNLRTISGIQLSRYRTPYVLSVDIYDRSAGMKRKMGKFLGQKQYRLIQDYNVQARYRIYKRGKRTILRRGVVYYTPYADTASSISYTDAEKKVIEKKLNGIAEKVAMKVSRYFQKDER